jgi:hypothetical protein
MIGIVSKLASPSTGLLLVVLFASAQLWCGDADCWSGTGGVQCASLICSLLGNHTTSSQDQNGDCSTECMCVCHIPILLVHPFDPEHHLTAQSTFFEFIASAPSVPIRSIYHPPKS